MKHLLIAFAACVLLCCCEKLDIPSTEKPTTNKANVTLHISTITQQPFAENTRAESALAELCARLNIAIFNTEGKKVQSVSQKSDTETFGTASFNLQEGEYRLVVVGHSGAGNATITSPEEVAFPNNKLTDTFSACQTLTVSAEHQDISVELTRCVAMIRLIMTDTTLPDNFASLELYYTGGSSTLNAATGFGAKNSRQTETRLVADAATDNNGHAVFEAYTIPHAATDELKLTATAKDASGNAICAKEVEALPITINQITQWQGLFFGSTPSTPAQSTMSVTINAAWSGTTTVEF